MADAPTPAADTKAGGASPLSKLGATVAGFQTILASVAVALANANGGVVSVFRNYTLAAIVFILFIALGIIGGIVVSAIASESTTRLRASFVVYVVAGIFLVFGGIQFGVQILTDPSHPTAATEPASLPIVLALVALGSGVYLSYWERRELERIKAAKQASAETARLDAKGQWRAYTLGVLDDRPVPEDAPAPPPEWPSPHDVPDRMNEADQYVGNVRIGAPQQVSGLALPVVLLALSATMFLLGSYGMGGLLITNARAVESPSVTGSLTATPSGMTLKADVAARGLLHNQHVLVRVDGVTTNTDEWSYDVVFAERMGPDENGNVVGSIEVPIDPAVWRVIEVRPFVDDTESSTGDTTDAPAGGDLYGATAVPHDHNPKSPFGQARFCDSGEDSCLQFLVPYVDNTPKITTEFTAGATAGAPGVLKVTSSVAGLPRDLPHLASMAPTSVDHELQIIVTGNDSTSKELARYTSPPIGGKVETTFNVPVPPNISLVTIDAEVVDPAPSSGPVDTAQAAHLVVHVQ